MNFFDIMSLAWRNLGQAKLRTALTVIGVVIGVGAIVTMVSLGLGLQRNIMENALSRLDLYTHITVFGAAPEELVVANDGPPAGQESEEAPAVASADTASAKPPRVLDDAAITRIQELKGVKYVVPQVSFSSFASYDDRTRRLNVSGAPATTEDYSAFSSFLAGGRFSGEDAPEAIVTENCLALFNAQPAAGGRGNRRFGGGGFRASTVRLQTDEERHQQAVQAIGKEITLLTLTANGAAANVAELRRSADAGADGQFERHVFRIVGVVPSQGGAGLTFGGASQMMVPIKQAKRLREAFRDPLAQISQALSGDPGYPSAEVRVIDPTQVQPVEDELKKLGFRSFSITTQIDAIKWIFIIIDGSLGLIGGLALLVASFGISNTMIMSIRERTREIGIMKAIGGSDGEIMRIFFVEASLIGFSGGVFGVLGGWVIDRIANLLANWWIVAQSTRVDFFSIPWFLWSGAIAFAVLVSLVAAIYPALRAARIDPIRALRHE